jgi:hypothetical protein
VGGQASVEAIKVKVWDDQLGVDVIRVVGFRGRCPCGDETGRQDSWDAARRAMLRHKAQQHGHNPGGAAARV